VEDFVCARLDPLSSYIIKIRSANLAEGESCNQTKLLRTVNLIMEHEKQPNAEFQLFP
jgi:hypothetical protein